MNLYDYCKCTEVHSVHTDFNDWYQFDICNKCGKVLEDSIRPLDDNGDIY